MTIQEISKSPEKIKAFLEWINVCLAGEAGTYSDYNGPKGYTGNTYSCYWQEKYGKYRSSSTNTFLPKKLELYTIDEVINMSNPYSLHATGRYQCLTKYLKGMAEDAGLKTSDVYSEFNQNLIGINLVLKAGGNLTKYSTDPNGKNYAKQRIGSKFLSGEMPFNEESILAFQLACSSVWSSIGVPYDTKNHEGTRRPKGSSYYKRDHARIQSAEFIQASIKLRKALNPKDVYKEGKAFSGDNSSVNATPSDNKTAVTTNTTVVNITGGDTVTQYTQQPYRDIVDLNEKEPPASTIEGKVIDNNSNPVPDTTVTITTNKYPNTPFVDTSESNAFRVWLLGKYPEYNDKRKQPGYPKSVLYRVDVPPQPYINSEALKKAWYEKGDEYERELNIPLTDKGKITSDQTIVKTDKDGKWIATSNEIISNVGTNVSIFTDGYNPISIDTILPSDSGSSMYNIPQLTLSPAPDPVKSASDQLITEMNESESEQIEKSLVNKIDKVNYITNTLNVKKEDLKRLLTPFVLKLIAAYGPALMQAVLKNLPLNQLTNLINCPPSATIIELINLRNNLVKQVNNVYNQINTLNKILGISNKIITSLKIGIQIIETIPYPATGVPPLGLPPLTAGAIAKIGSTKEAIFKTLEISQGIIDIVTIASSSLGTVMGIILRLLNTLDVITQYCAKDQNVSFELINNDLNDFVNESTGISNSRVISNTQNNNNYKGFKLELKLDEVNKTPYPRRYAQALNKQGVPVLKTDLSFASDPQVLISQLKFIIDSNPNITPE